MKPYVTGDTFQGDYGGLMEPYWLNSDGFFVHAAVDVPLFTGWNETGDGRFCVAARAAPPFKPAPSARLRLRYTLCSSSDLRSANS